ncbi:ferredoxin reductase [Corynebacterium hindlerae]|uniref:ferredoxin reductase n=1 Tax=Corynebacterium hindlerae TaxID=699041 RepID=UPI0031B6BFC8
MTVKTSDALKGIRSALKAWTTPLLPDDYTALINPLWSIRELRGVIRFVDRDIAADTVLLDIEPGWGVPVRFEAGQYIGIGVQMNGRFVWRSYSIVNTPKRERHSFQICVRGVSGGKLSQHLLENARPGQVIRLAAPAGDFYLTSPVPEKLLFITAGSGITPVISMLRHLDEQGALHDVTLIHSIRHREDLLFASTLADLERRHPGFRFILQVTSEQGRITSGDVERLVPDFAERAAYACGPAQMLNEAEQWWDGGVDKAYPLRTERFTLDRVSDAKGGTIRLGEKSVTADGATTILEAAEEAGVQLPFGCRMGICQTCVQTVKEGHAHNLRTGETHEPGSRVRVCCTVANGDITLDI